MAEVTLTELREEIATKRAQLHELFAQAGPDLDMSRVTTISGDTDTKVADMRRRNEELAELVAKRDRLEVAEGIRDRNRLEMERASQPSETLPIHSGRNGNGAIANHASQDWFRKGLRGIIEDHKAFRAFAARPSGAISIELPFTDYKTLVQLSTATPQAVRQDVVNMGVEERTVADLMLQGTMDRSQIDYFEETTFDPTDAETVAEAGTKPELTLAYTLRTETARKIAVNIPATDESLADISWLESQIRGRLAFAVRRTEEVQLLSGDGSAPNLRGILNRSGIQTQAKGSDPTPDAIYKGMQLVRGAAGSGFAEPTAVVMHPNDWTDIKLLRTSDGIYLWGNPSDEGPDRIWGLPVRQTTAMTENTALVGAFRPHAQVLRRENITVTMSTEHSTYFVENKVLIQAEERLALAVFRPSAFAKVTGI